MGHINANSIAGFKHAEIRQWLEASYFDLFVITETKLDNSFPNSQLKVNGFRMLRRDRNLHGGGVLMYFRSDIPYVRLRRLEQTSAIECLAVRVKLAKSWTTFIGPCRSPAISKFMWTKELTDVLEAANVKSESIFLLGDFNCDLLEPDKPPKAGRDLVDIMEVYGFVNLINHATRITRSTETLIDLILTKSRSRVLKAGVVDPHTSVITRWFLPF